MLRAGSGKYDNSTLFVDIIGPVANNTDNFTMDAANTAVATQVAAVEATVKLGYMVRSSADYLVRGPPLLPCMFYWCACRRLSNVGAAQQQQR